MHLACAPRVLRVIVRLMQSDEDSHHKILKNDYLFDKKKENFFSPFFSSAKNSRFITIYECGWGVGARVIKRMFFAQEKK
jgi:hypothetical protein